MTGGSLALFDAVGAVTSHGAPRYEFAALFVLTCLMWWILFVQMVRNVFDEGRVAQAEREISLWRETSQRRASISKAQP